MSARLNFVILTLSHYKKTMKTLFLLLSILSIPVIASAQGMLPPKVDGFTHERTISTEAFSIASANEDYIIAYFTRTDSGYYLNLRVDLLPEHHDVFTIPGDNNILFRLADNSLLTLNVPKTIVAKSMILTDRYYTYTYWSATVVFPMTRDEIVRLSQTDKTGARVEAKEGNIDFGITSKESLTFKKLALLILAQP